jgi:hypothetical protein
MTAKRDNFPGVRPERKVAKPVLEHGGFGLLHNLGLKGRTLLDSEDKPRWSGVALPFLCFTRLPAVPDKQAPSGTEEKRRFNLPAKFR